MEQVAVVGAKIRVPGAETAETLWANMIAGTSSIAPLSAADLSNARIDESETQSPSYVARAGLIDGIEEFDHAFFDYSFREAQHIDPQQRLLLTLSHQLLETICPQTRSVGVFVSIGFPSYLIRNLVPARADATLSSMGNSSHGAATRIAYKLNLAGPAMTVECGCSSSLVALHMARLSILTGQCEMALVGGCSLRIPAKQGYVHQRDGVLSEDGVCRPLDERATGTIFTSGAVVVAVKKLSAAVEDGDDIWCVIRSTAVNNDGNAKAGFTAPSVNGQRNLIQRAYARAGVSPRSIGYLEAHGTGTALGDPIEVQALTEAFAAFTPDCGYCSLGSIKANIGHLDVAAGLMGVVKASLCLRKREMPPLANFSRINPKINLAASPFYIQTEPRHWEVHDAEPRRAAVNSLGVGGTNAHALMEEAPPWRPGLSSRWGLVFASAKGPAELEAKATAITAAARAAPDQVGDLAYTAQLCPPHHATRGAYFVDARAPTGVDSKAFRPTGDWREHGIVFAFSGQGTQYEGMGRELYEHVAAFRTAFDQAASLFRSAHAEDPLALLGADLAAISRAEALQPYLFSLEYALGRVLLDLGVQPTLLLGHSLGEYVAATFAGVFDLETAVRVVAERSRLMASAPRGAMLVVQAPEHVAQCYTGENISLCVVNGARSSVLGGTVEAIDRLARELEQAGEKVIRLNTSHAFHSHLMAGPAAEFERTFDGVTLRAPQIPIVSNLDGRKDDPLRFANPQYWVRHLREPVRFIDGLRTIAAATPPPVLLELGPGRSVSTHLLSSFPLSDVAVLASLAPGHECEHFFGIIGQLWLNGVELDLRALYREWRGRITPPPPSQLVSRRCWVDPPEATTLATPVAAAGSVPGKREKISDWFYEQRWLPRTRSDENLPPDETRRELTVFSTSHAAGKELCRALELAGAVVRLIDIQDVCQARLADDVADLERSILARLDGRKADRAVALFAGGDGRSSNADAIHTVLVATAIAKIVRSTRRDGAQLIVIGTHGVRTTTEPLHWWNAWMDGFTTVANQEVSGLVVRYVDLEDGIFAESEPGSRALLAHTILHGSDRVSALRGGLVWERELRAVRFGSRRDAGSLLRRVLIVGGTGNVGLTYALHFLRAGASGIAIVSRSAEDVEPRLAASDVPDRQIWARRRRLIDEAKRARVDLCFLNANADSPDQVDRAAQEAAQRFAGLDAIVHASGAPAELHFRAFLETNRAHLETLYRAKVEVAQSLDRAARRLHVPRVLAVSSISGTLGGLGLLGYATSHNLLDAYAASSSDDICRWTSIAWDAWDFYKEDRSADARDVGIDALAISEQEGLEALCVVQGAAWPEGMIISSGDLHHRHAAWVLRTGSEQRRLELGERPNLREEYAAPKGTTDRRLVELVGDTIGLKTVGIRDNFFDLGCDSLIALTLVDQINKALGSDISAIEIFKHPTVEKLAAWLERTSAEANAVAVASPQQVADAPAVDDGRANERRNYFAAMRNRRELAS